MIEFQAWPKTPRLFRDMIITEKIDGTNAAVHVQPVEDYVGRLVGDGTPHPAESQTHGHAVVRIGDVAYIVAAQSRKRLITPEQDNFGFAAWVRDNATSLATILGPGIHYGEWFGHGIQRGYGLPKGERRFYLFNVKRYAGLLWDEEGWPRLKGLDTVPMLYQGPFSTDVVEMWVEYLAKLGSFIPTDDGKPFPRPEGVVVYHSAANSVFKVTIENDQSPKGE